MASVFTSVPSCAASVTVGFVLPLLSGFTEFVMSSSVEIALSSGSEEFVLSSSVEIVLSSGSEEFVLSTVSCPAESALSSASGSAAFKVSSLICVSSASTSVPSSAEIFASTGGSAGGSQQQGYLHSTPVRG